MRCDHQRAPAAASAHGRGPTRVAQASVEVGHLSPNVLRTRSARASGHAYTPVALGKNPGVRIALPAAAAGKIAT